MVPSAGPVVVEVRDVAAVRRVTQDRLQRPAVVARIETAVALRRRVAQVERRYRDVRRRFPGQGFDDGPVALPAIDADQDLHAAAEGLREHRANGLRERIADDGHHDDADVERGLQAGGHEIKRERNESSGRGMRSAGREGEPGTAASQGFDRAGDYTARPALSKWPDRDRPLTLRR